MSGCGADPTRIRCWPASPPQERRILDLMAEGQTNRQIAGTLFLAEKTVKNYVSNLLAKLGMERRTQAASYATRVAERSDHTRRTDSTGT